VKISRFSKKQLKELLERQKKREYWKWECVRRNKDYKKDFEKYGRKQLNRGLADRMLGKWECFADLPDPKVESPEGVGVSQPVATSRIGDIFDLLPSSKERMIHLWKPGTLLKKFDGTTQKNQGWTVLNSVTGDQEALTQDNCPCSITITVLCEPGFQKGELEAILLKEFGQVYKKLLAAQKKVLRRSPRPRFSEFENYIKVYELRKGNPAMPWAEIAQAWKDWVRARAGKKKMLVSESEKQNARDYWGMAVYLIEKEGWKML
jgi:hypothetical protein